MARISFVDYPEEYMDFEFPPVRAVGIVIHDTKGKEIYYTPGRAIPEDIFAEKIVTALHTIYTTAEGKHIIDTLVGSEHTYHIYRVKSMGKVKFCLGKNGELDSGFEQLIHQKDYCKAADYLKNIEEFSVGILIGSYDPVWNYNQQDGTKMNLTLALGHELFHAYQFETGKTNGAFIGGMVLKIKKHLNDDDPEHPLHEAHAVGFENYLRGSLFVDTEYDDTRTLYSKEVIKEYLKPDIDQEWYKDVWDFFVENPEMEVTEFIEGGKVFPVWKTTIPQKVEEKGQVLLNK